MHALGGWQAWCRVWGAPPGLPEAEHGETGIGACGGESGYRVVRSPGRRMLGHQGWPEERDRGVQRCSCPEAKMTHSDLVWPRLNQEPSKQQGPPWGCRLRGSV